MRVRVLLLVETIFDRADKGQGLLPFHIGVSGVLKCCLDHFCRFLVHCQRNANTSARGKRRCADNVKCPRTDVAKAKGSCLQRWADGKWSSQQTVSNVPHNRTGGKWHIKQLALCGFSKGTAVQYLLLQYPVSIFVGSPLASNLMVCIANFKK